MEKNNCGGGCRECSTEIQEKVISCKGINCIADLKRIAKQNRKVWRDNKNSERENCTGAYSQPMRALNTEIRNFYCIL